MRKNYLLSISCVLLVAATLSMAFGQEHAVGITTSEETLAKSYGGKAYSPYAERSFRFGVKRTCTQDTPWMQLFLGTGHFMKRLTGSLAERK